jgi:hypothetical protein
MTEDSLPEVAAHIGQLPYLWLNLWLRCPPVALGQAEGVSGTGDGPATAEEFLAGQPLGLATLAWVRRVLAAEGPVTERLGRSQVAFRHRRGFAWLWLPGQYLTHPRADVVLSLGLGRPVESPRFKEVVHPSALRWMHHLELHSVTDLDDEVADWLREAYAGAG